MVLPFLCVGSCVPGGLGPRGHVSGQRNSSVQTVFGWFQVCACGQVSALVVLLTVSLWEVWEVCLCRAGEDRESGWSDGGLCPWCLELSS